MNFIEKTARDIQELYLRDFNILYEKLYRIKTYVTECKNSNVYDGLCIADSILKIIDEGEE